MATSDIVAQKILQDKNYVVACVLMLSMKGNSIDEKDLEFFLNASQEYKQCKGLSPGTLKRARRKAIRYIDLIVGKPVKKPSPTNAKEIPSKRVSYLSPKYIRLDFPQKSSLVESVRYMGRVQRVREGKLFYWRAGLTLKNILILLDKKFTLDSAVQTWFSEKKETLKRDRERPLDSISNSDLQLNLPLHPYQEEGVSFLERVNGRGLLGDEMGLGKTAQAIAWSHYANIPNKRILVICPASVKLNWQKEFLKWTGEESYPLSGRTPMMLTSNMNILIINHDIVSFWEPVLCDYRPDIVIIDECHKIKNVKAKRTMSVIEIVKEAPHVIGISGTPITSRPDEFFTILKILDSANFSNYWEYAQAYCGARHGRFGWETKKPSHLDILHLEVSQVMIRRKKSEVLKDLPEKQKTVVPIEFDKKAYIKAEEEFEKWVEEGDTDDNIQGFAKVETLKQACLDAKLSNCINWVDDFLESGEKIGIFTTHTKTIDALKQHYKERMVYIDGRVPSNKRQDIVRRFAEDPNVVVFAGNIQAAGEGIDGLQNMCSNVVFFELGWTPGEHDQAEDRFHRIGQKDGVMVWYLIAQGTIENKIMFALDEKRKVLDQVLDGKTSVRRENLLMELIKSYKKGK